MLFSVRGQGQCPVVPPRERHAAILGVIRTTCAREDCPVVSIQTVYVCRKVVSANVDLVCSVISGQSEK